MPKPDGKTALASLMQAFEHYNEHHPHNALSYRPPPRRFDARRILQSEAGTGVLKYGGESKKIAPDKTVLSRGLCCSGHLWSVRNGSSQSPLDEVVLISSLAKFIF